MRWGRVILVAFSLSCALWSETGAERLAKIRALTFTPGECYRVRDLVLEREDIKLHFSDGYLLFAEPVEGRTIAALFLAASDTGEATVVVLPPTRSERQSMVRFLDSPVLEEEVRTVMMFFSDDTALVLRRAIAENPFSQPDPEAGQKWAKDWTPVARNILGDRELRLLVDALSLAGPDGVPQAGLFTATISGAKLGLFEILVDPRRSEQIAVGQVIWQEGQRFYDIWTSFPARSIREGRKRPFSDTATLENYRIEADLAEDLSMRVRARATLVAGSGRERAVGFELSRDMKVSKVSVDGRPAEFLESGTLDASGVRRRGNDMLVVVLEKAPEPGGRHLIEFEYAGNVITDSGHGIYYVGARGNWYPTHGAPFTEYELLFQYPKRLQMVATGRQVETSVAGDVRTTRWKSDGKIRLAAFNLGDYERASVKVGEYTVEVCANKRLEPELQRRAPPLLPMGTIDHRNRTTPLGAFSAPEPAASPARRTNQVAHDSGEAVQFFLSRFGPPATRHLTVSPIPGRFGEGFPGLVYLSTLSYYQPEDQPLEKLSAGARVFYTEQLGAHEIAHQWWGNLVTSSGYHDEWLMESLADYSALLYLEQRKGGRVAEGILARYKSNLLAKLESGGTVESAGAIVLGERLRSSRSPAARHVIIYEKGAWVLHMLRHLMGDQKFFALLRELRKRYERQEVTTEQFRELAAQFLPAVPQDPNLENFFYQWVYSTGVPTLKMEYRVSGKAPPYRLTGVVRQSGVPEDFSVPVPIEIQLAGTGEKIELRVQTADGEAPFSLMLDQRPSRVALDPKDSVLAIKQ
ncbi:MAG: hypothetical protein HY236_10795 [Acidobacteria bacterium]|nr:hypothetical protein [Acidobacteriota bacterium]